MEKELFKFHVILSARVELVVSLHKLGSVAIGIPMAVAEYSHDEEGDVDGVVIKCDRGHGYSFDDGEAIVTLYPGQTYKFTHSYTDTSDGT